MATVIFWARRQIALISSSRTTDKDQPRLMGQTEYVIPLIFLPEGRDAPLMCLEYCIYFIYLFIYLFIYFGATAPQWIRSSSFTRFLDHTQRRTTVGRTPLDE